MSVSGQMLDEMIPPEVHDKIVGELVTEIERLQGLLRNAERDRTGEINSYVDEVRKLRADLSAMTERFEECRAQYRTDMDDLEPKVEQLTTDRDAATARAERAMISIKSFMGDVDMLQKKLSAVEEERETYFAALTKISAIRDSIVGMQGFNFSEHAYPLVAALDTAGFKGAGYEIARRNLGTLVEQAKAAEAQRDAYKAVAVAAAHWAVSSYWSASRCELRPNERSLIAAVDAARAAGLLDDGGVEP